MEAFNHSDVVQEMAKTLAKLLYRRDTSDHSFKAKITEKSGPKKYKILYSGNTYAVTSSADYQPGDFVWVCAPCNNWENLFIVCRT